MAWKDGINNAKRVFQNGTPREKLEYFWDYYKWYLIVLFFVLGMLGNIIYANITAKDCVLGGIILNSTDAEEVVNLKQEFLEYSAIDTQKEDVFFASNYYFSDDIDVFTSTSSYETLQLLTAKIVAGEVDFMVGDFASMNHFAYGQYFFSLSEMLSEEMVKKYEPYFLYYDRAFVDEMSDIDTVDDVFALIAYPDPKKPELMEEPVPIFIDASECKKVQDIYSSVEDVYVVAFTINGENNTKVLEFLEFLTGEKNE